MPLMKSQSLISVNVVCAALYTVCFLYVKKIDDMKNIGVLK